MYEWLHGLVYSDTFSWGKKEFDETGTENDKNI